MAFSFGCRILHLEHGGSHKVTPCGLIHSRGTKEIQGVQVTEYLVRVRCIQEVFKHSPVNLGVAYLIAQLNWQVGQAAAFDLPLRPGHMPSLRLGAVDGVRDALPPFTMVSVLGWRRVVSREEYDMNPRDENCTVFHTLIP